MTVTIAALVLTLPVALFFAPMARQENRQTPIRQTARKVQLLR